MRRKEVEILRIFATTQRDSPYCLVRVTTAIRGCIYQNNIRLILKNNVAIFCYLFNLLSHLESGETTTMHDFEFFQGTTMTKLLDPQQLALLRAKDGYLCDMDGVIYHGNVLLPGVKEFVAWLRQENKRFLFLTNSSEKSPKELQQKLARMGLEIGEEHFYTSALAMAKFLKEQSPGCSAYVLGAPGLVKALYDIGVTMNDVDPQYVVVGETDMYNYTMITKAIDFVRRGARLVGTNPDNTCPTETGIAPACRALMAPIEIATGKTAYYVGKPNALMLRTGLHLLEVHSAQAALIGDRMDTDIIAGLEGGMMTALVLSGISTLDLVRQFSYRPSVILNGVGDIPGKAAA